ncbi:MAG: phosphotransferase [Thermomicrobiales bacterium]|nr:phosphotransferase [Thermomicrobiales bacterium]
MSTNQKNDANPIPADLREAAGLLLPGHGDLGTIAGAPGAIRVETAQGPARVTRWAPGTTEARIEALHDLFKLRERPGAGFLPVPIGAPSGGASIALPGGHRYEARGWLPGAPATRDPLIPGQPLPNPISVDHVSAAARAIATLHTISVPVARNRAIPAVPLTTLHRQTAIICRETKDRLLPLVQQFPPMREWVRAGDRIVPLAADAIGGLLESDEKRLVVAHAGLWPEHILFVREQGTPVVSGLAGWGNSVVSSPLVDLAQLVSRTRGWSNETIEAVVENYQDVAALAPLERRSLPLIVALDLLREAARLLDIYMRRDDGVFKASEYTLAFNALERTLDALDAILPVIEGFDAPTPKKGRKWVHRPRREA